ncbi:MAG: PDZ domain-containing protein [Pirellulaceae bacterium]|jgi:serine protease Do|nr:trypsin-like peptidase domain-containing protein [Thermoguttaceae bacterium]MDI9443100.1 trypsin-like peptidase domain-containing protein [Planctomycetota bacterium]NLZ00024.1 PDZ domain-containing protein [Pirellulaceae bacterium]
MFHPRRGREPSTRRFSGLLARSFLYGLFLSAAVRGGWAQAEQDARAVGARPPAGIEDLKALEARIQTTVSKVAACVVGVSGGSGVVVSDDGHVLTVAHVSERAGRSVAVTFPDGRRVRAVTLGNDHGVDAGLVKIVEEGPWPHVEMGRSGDLEPGQWCLTLGYPVSFERGKPPVLRIGRVLRSGPTIIMADSKIMGGDSGGPLFDLDGRVIGIGSRCDDRVILNVHVPIDCFRNQWERLVKGEDFNSLRRAVAFLGVAPAEDPEDQRIGTVFPNSPAAEAGIKPGDTVLRFDGQPISRYDDLPPLVQRKSPGNRVEIELRRGDEVFKVEAELAGVSG